MILRALALAYYFPPRSTAEAWCAAKGLGSIPDTDVDVLAIEASGREDHSLDPWLAQHFRVVDRVRIPKIVSEVPLEKFGTAFNIPDKYRLLSGRMKKNADRLAASGYDVLISRSQPHSAHLVAARIAEQHRLPWVAVFSDPWSHNPYLRVGGFNQRLNERLERIVAGRADAIVVTSDDTKALLAENNPEAAAKIHVIPHAYVPELYRGDDDKERSDGGSRVIRHLGSFYGPRSPEPLIAAFEGLATRRKDVAENWTLELYGDVARRYRVVTGRNARVRFFESVDHLTALHLMRSADALVTVEARLESSLFLPSKLIDYVGAQRPVVGLTPPGAARCLVEGLGGWVADPTDEEAGIRALSSAVDWVLGHDKWPFGDDLVRERYDASTVGKQLRSLVESVLH